MRDSRFSEKAGYFSGDSMGIGDGTVSTPGLYFSSDTNTGIYRPTADSLAIAAGGSQCLEITADNVQFQDGTAADPALTFDSDTDTGIYRVGSNKMGFAAGGAMIAYLDTTQFVVEYADSPQFLARRPASASGGGSTASFGLGCYDSNTAWVTHTMYSGFNTNNTAGSVDGRANILSMQSGSLIVLAEFDGASTQFRVRDGSSGTPTISFQSDVDTGLYLAGTNSLGISAGGSQKMNLSNAGVGFNGTAAIAKPTITGSRGGNAALASLLTELANYGLITDSSSA